MVAAKSAVSLKDYLKKYQDDNEEETKKLKKKKKKSKPENGGFIVVDEDPVWQKPVKFEEEEDGDLVDEMPQVDEDIEVKRMKRLEQARSKRPVGMISEDGSGWVSVSDIPKMVNSSDQVSDISPPRRRRADTTSSEREHEVDLSPPRKRRARNDTPSPKAELKPSAATNADLSPPRKRRARNDTPSPEAELKPSSATNADLSPPRKHRSRDDLSSRQPEQNSSKTITDLSPPRRKHKHGSSITGRGDISPQYRRRDPASPRSHMKPSDFGREAGNISPPQKQRERHFSTSPEPKRKSSHFVAQDFEVSPSRRVRRDNSHPSHATDLSPSRGVRKDRSVSNDLSAPSGSLTLGQNDAGLTSPALDLSPPRKMRKKSPTPKQKPKTGLVTGQDIKEEIAKAKKEDFLRFKEMDPSVSGRGAEPVYRDKITGERMSKEEFLNSRKKKEEKPKEVKLEWGKGLAQKREAEARIQELEREKEQPFARSRDDSELDKMLKERLRWGDPMAHLVKKKQMESVLPDFGDDEKMKESGFIIPQEIPSHSWIRRGLDFPPNRYGIKPGRHWDGVDRSTGFEKQLFKRMNEKQATQREAYLWSVSDM